jgi:hypothetical protein
MVAGQNRPSLGVGKLKQHEQLRFGRVFSPFGLAQALLTSGRTLRRYKGHFD